MSSFKSNENIHTNEDWSYYVVRLIKPRQPKIAGEAKQHAQTTNCGHTKRRQKKRRSLVLSSNKGRFNNAK